MKVSELISELKKMPKDLDVYWSDHDHGEYEVNAQAKSVSIVNKKLAKEKYEERQIRQMGDFTPDKYVTIRP